MVSIKCPLCDNSIRIGNRALISVIESRFNNMFQLCLALRSIIYLIDNRSDKFCVERIIRWVNQGIAAKGKVISGLNDKLCECFCLPSWKSDSHPYSQRLKEEEKEKYKGKKSFILDELNPISGRLCLITDLSVSL